MKKARLYATACGVYEACINGKKVGDAFMAPGWTSYPHRIAYQTYDITALLTDEMNETKADDASLEFTDHARNMPTEEEECFAAGGIIHEIAITVGNGWYKGELGLDAKPDNYGDRTALLAMLRIVYL